MKDPKTRRSRSRVPASGAMEQTVPNQTPGYCFLCGQDTGHVAWTGTDHRAVRCACGIIFMDPRPDPDTVDLATEKHSDGYYSVNAPARLRWVARFQPTGKLLEVGCGAGYFLSAASAAGYHVTGVDPDPGAASYVRRTFGFTVEEAFIEESRLPDGAFDVVFHVDLLSHFPDPIIALQAMVRRVRPGGYVLFEVGGQKPLATRYYKWLGTAGYPQHLWLYEESGLRSLLENAGLEVIEIRRFGLLADLSLQAIVRPLYHLFSGRRPQPSQDTVGTISGLRLHWDRLQHFSRYVLGRYMPPVGPQTLWVATRRPNPSGDVRHA